jgi:hypothetical protein
MLGGTPFEVDYDDMGCLTRNGDASDKPNLGTVRFPMSVGMTRQACEFNRGMQHTRGCVSSPGVLQMKYRTRIYCSESRKTLMWGASSADEFPESAIFCRLPWDQASHLCRDHIRRGICNLAL